MGNLTQSILKNIKKKWQNFKYPEFAKIKNLTHGYLSTKVYHEIYQAAFNAEEEIMIDIGPAQGGSSICLGLGIQQSGKTNSKVFSIEKGIGSRALPTLKDIEQNISTLKNNIEQYKLGDICTVLAGDVKEVYQKTNEPHPISLMFIDADGALDRDFQLFYNRLSPNAYLIIDDYSNIINKLATERYLQWKSYSDIENYVQSKGANSFLELCPLGKEYTVYQFVNYFLQQGLIIKDKVIGMTFFGRKANNREFQETDFQNLQQIRQQILQEYYQKNTYLSND